MLHDVLTAFSAYGVHSVILVHNKIFEHGFPAAYIAVRPDLVLQLRDERYLHSATPIYCRPLRQKALSNNYCKLFTANYS